MKICVVGLGYVGMSMSVLLARVHDVIAIDIDEDRVAQVNAGTPTVADPEMEQMMANQPLSLSATTNSVKAYADAEIIIIATPTDYDEQKSFFDTSSLEAVIAEILQHNTDATIVIKSTVPVGFTQSLCHEYETDRIAFSPEFLREGKALYDNLHPSRIVVGANSVHGHQFSEILASAAEKKDVPVLLTHPTEAEAIKLFSNTYLAMRVAFFNELDSFGMARDLDVRAVIEGVCHDPRVGGGYNNPSFGYGGYCLPKDTKQLLANYQHVPNHIIQGVVNANSARKDFVAEAIFASATKTVGIYRMIMKKGSDNIRNSAVHGVMKRLKAQGVDIIIFEPRLDVENYFNTPVVNDETSFFEQADLIVANRMDQALEAYKDRVFTRDIFMSG